MGIAAHYKLPEGVREKVCLLLEAVKHKTVVEIDFENLRLLSAEDTATILEKCKQSLADNKHLRVLRVVVRQSTNRQCIQELFNGLSCLNLTELYLTKEEDQEESSTSKLAPIAEFLAHSCTLEKLCIERSHVDGKDFVSLASALNTNQSLQSFKMKSVRYDASSSHQHIIHSFFSAMSMHPRLSTVELVSSDDSSSGYTPMFSLLRHWLFQSNNMDAIETLSIDDGEFPNKSTPKDMHRLTCSISKPFRIDNYLSFEVVDFPKPVATVCTQVLERNPCKLNTISLQWNTLKDLQAVTKTVDSIADATALKTVRLLGGPSTGLPEGNYDSCAERFGKELFRSSGTVEELELIGLDMNTAWIILKGYQQNSSLQRLTINGENPSQKIHSRRRRACRSRQSDVTKVSKDNSCAGQKLCELLATSLPKSSLVGLKLCNLSQLTDKCWVPVVKALQRNTSLERLELQNVGVGNVTMEALATSTNKTLDVLNVQKNQAITTDGVRCFFENPGSMCGLKEFWFHHEDEDNEDNSMGSLARMQQLYLQLNRCGLFHDDLPVALWPVILERMTTPENADLLHYLMRHRLFELFATIPPRQQPPTTLAARDKCTPPTAGWQLGKLPLSQSTTINGKSRSIGNNSQSRLLSSYVAGVMELL